MWDGVRGVIAFMQVRGLLVLCVRGGWGCFGCDCVVHCGMWCIVCFGCWVSCRVGGGVCSGGFGVLGECST